jgi:hypothetical protein
LSKKENIISIETLDDDKDYKGFDNLMKDHTNRIKDSTAARIFEKGESLLDEIDLKKDEQEKQKDIWIKYIIKKSKKKIYFPITLKTYDYRDVRDIYLDVKDENKFFLIKLFDQIF